MNAERRRKHLEDHLQFWRMQMILGAKAGRIGDPRPGMRLEAQLIELDAAETATEKPRNPVEY